MTCSTKIKAIGVDTFRVALKGAAILAATLFTFDREDGGTTAVLRANTGAVVARTDWTYELNIDDLFNFIRVNTGADGVELTAVGFISAPAKIERLQHAAGV